MSKAVEQLLLKQVELQQVVREGIQRLCQPQDSQPPRLQPRLTEAPRQRASMLAVMSQPSPIVGGAPRRASTGSNAIVGPPNDSTRGTAPSSPLPRSPTTNKPLHRRAPPLPFASLPPPPARCVAPPAPPRG